ncbi:hypothetical protein COY26_00910 [Candidatus Woesearchaeota archaeon CG_4_10_14_0_2_um_filter_33_10]|nr:MAG: hypothetical protein COV14_01745 [Candidatus Woesearchaeota archaeon CG10_big_fil_rev_8_21_14_0_10_33_12]PIU72059.1 MAG: hypothetical protein COS79_04655 [Candidatus Woesearchaeota archaeon CG06_land_8_20_14_3_00_33_13]PIZ53782.1 MAG: hypothetical protein COY26_00910 [Candidatus Woesearchaeota archaeon CG_4_10_14_0_2_um_filter_33_10]
MAKDIPKATIAVLLVLTILVSIIGTWTVLESISQGEKIPGEMTSTSQGNINLNIEKPHEPVKTDDTATIMLTIK